MKFVIFQCIEKHWKPPWHPSQLVINKTHPCMLDVDAYVCIATIAGMKQRKKLSEA